ncbi:MAG TPA: hypothetical protein VFI92_13390, partial [Steroidobacteraceae bacterium]|nr:hypothetical protein [Steroidobacteraceae bacterium]
NQSAYGISDVLASQILEGKVAAPPEAQAFTAALARATAATASGTTEAASPTAPAPAPAPAPASEPATTYPMEDPNPGTPPPGG